MSEADIQHNLLVLSEAARQLLHDGYHGPAALLTVMLRQAVDAEEHLFREAATLAAIEYLRAVIRGLPASQPQPKEELFLCPAD